MASGWMSPYLVGTDPHRRMWMLRIRRMDMLKGAWILPLLLMLVLLPALAYADSVKPASSLSRSAFKDLPGVVPEKSRVTSGDDEAGNDGVRCEAGIGYVRNHGNFRRDVFGRDFPTQVYRCESKGVTYTGTDMPPNRPWVPGINPHFLPID